MTAPAVAIAVGDPIRRSRIPLTATAAVSGAVLIIILVAGLAAPWIAPHDPLQQSLADALQPPGGAHLLGTDELGRDVFSRVVWGVRPLALIVVLAVGIAAAFGFLYGLLAGTVRGPVATVLMRIADIQLSIPPIVLAVLLAVAMEPGITSVITAIALVTWPEYARIVRAETLRVRTSDYVALARVAGLSPLQVLRHHVVPNVVSGFVVIVTLNLSIAILFASALSFLGLGVQPPTPDWGSMLADATQYLSSWWLVLAPGAAIMVSVLALNLVGDHVRDLLDPRISASVDTTVRTAGAQV
jgi:peptide/nickel transport system permease protein